MNIVRPVPVGLERASLPDRLRWWAAALGGTGSPNLRLSAALEEAATEVELGQTTALTYRGGELDALGQASQFGPPRPDCGSA